jgi:hypothetical protein
MAIAFENIQNYFVTLLPRGILHVFNTILYENEFQNPQIFQAIYFLVRTSYTFQRT